MNLFVELPIELGGLRLDGVFLAMTYLPKIQERLAAGEIQDILTKREWELANRFRMFSRKLSWLGGQMAGKLALQQIKEKVPFKDIEILRNDNGAPCFDNQSDVYVTISHCKDYAIAAASQNPIGIDMEEIAEHPGSFVDMWLTAREKDALKQVEICNQNKFVTTCWTLKEAFSKITGKGSLLPFDKICSVQMLELAEYKTAIVTFENMVISLLLHRENK